MSRHLLMTTAGYAALLAGWGMLRATSGRGLDTTLLVAVGFLEVVLVLQAVGELIWLLTGGHVAEPAVHAGYLVASIVVLPLAVTNTSAARGRWDAAIVSLGALVATVVVLRMGVTGG